MIVQLRVLRCRARWKRWSQVDGDESEAEYKYLGGWELPRVLLFFNTLLLLSTFPKRRGRCANEVKVEASCKREASYCRRAGV